MNRYGERVALAFKGQHVSYHETEENVDQLALYFIDIGLRPYDGMILQSPNEWEFLYSYFAAVKIEVIPILALPVHREREISFFAQVTQAHVIFSRFQDSSHQDMSCEIRMILSGGYHISRFIECDNAKLT